MKILSGQFKWYLLLIIIVFGLFYSFYHISVKFDYTWTWSKIPSYFVYLEKEEVLVETEGTIKITGEPKNVQVVTENGEVFSYQIPKGQVVVDDGDMVFMGDAIGYTQSWQAGLFIKGLWVTVKLSFFASILALFLGIISGLARPSKNPVLKWLSLFYVESIRGTPLLVQLFIIYFMVGSVLGIDSRFLCGMLGLAIFAGAYVAEIIRGGIESIHHGQMEAARSLGLNHFQAMMYVIMPQVFRRSLPALAGVFISLVKDSSLVSVMALTDLTKAGREVVSSTFMVFETWITVALLYFVVTFLLSYLVKIFEGRLALGEKR